MTGGAPYQIDLRGRLSDETLRPYAYEFVVTRTDDQTRLAGHIRDPSHLRGIVAHLATLGIEILRITPTGEQGRDIASD